MLCSGTLGENSKLDEVFREKQIPCEKNNATSGPVSPKGGMTENPDSVKDDSNWQFPNPAPRGVFSVLKHLNLQFLHQEMDE